VKGNAPGEYYFASSPSSLAAGCVRRILGGFPAQVSTLVCETGTRRIAQLVVTPTRAVWVVEQGSTDDDVMQTSLAPPQVDVLEENINNRDDSPMTSLCAVGEAVSFLRRGAQKPIITLAPGAPRTETQTGVGFVPALAVTSTKAFYGGNSGNILTQTLGASVDGTVVRTTSALPVTAAALEHDGVTSIAFGLDGGGVVYGNATTGVFVDVPPAPNAPQGQDAPVVGVDATHAWWIAFDPDLGLHILWRGDGGAPEPVGAIDGVPTSLLVDDEFVMWIAEPAALPSQIVRIRKPT
jgi:hypothetical protein